MSYATLNRRIIFSVIGCYATNLYSSYAYTTINLGVENGTTKLPRATARHMNRCMLIFTYTAALATESKSTHRSNQCNVILNPRNL